MKRGGCRIAPPPTEKTFKKPKVINTKLIINIKLFKIFVNLFQRIHYFMADIEIEEKTLSGLLSNCSSLTTIENL